MSDKVKTPSEIMRELMDYYADPSADQVLFSHTETATRQKLSEQDRIDEKGLRSLTDIFRSGAKVEQLDKIEALANMMLAKWSKWVISRDPATGKKQGKDEDSYNKFVSAMGFPEAVVAAAAKGKDIDKPEPEAESEPETTDAEQAVKDNPDYKGATSESLEEAKLMELFGSDFKKKLRNLAARAVEMEKIPGINVPAGEVKLDLEAEPEQDAAAQEPVQNYTGGVMVDEIEKVAVAELGLNKGNVERVYAAISGMGVKEARATMESNAMVKDVFSKLGLAMLLKAEKEDR